MDSMVEFNVTYVNLTVSNITRSAHFYENILGLRPVEASGSGPGAQVAAFDAGGLVIRLAEQGPGGTGCASTGEDRQSLFWHVGFQTRNVDAFATHLRENSVKFAAEPANARGGVKVCFFYDPDGALLEVVEGNLAFSDEIKDPERAEGASALPLLIHHVALQVDDRASAADTLANSFGFEHVGEISYPDHNLDIRFMGNERVLLELFEFGDAEGPARFMDDSQRWRFDVIAISNTATGGDKAISLHV